MQNQELTDMEYAIDRYAERSLDDELGGVINGDIIMLQVAICAIGLYTCIALSDCRDGFVGWRLWLTMRGVTLICPLVAERTRCMLEVAAVHV
jgi:hypothetical protein